MRIYSKDIIAHPNQIAPLQKRPMVYTEMIYFNPMAVTRVSF